jgi:hypothetical protein
MGSKKENSSSLEVQMLSKALEGIESMKLSLESTESRLHRALKGEVVEGNQKAVDASDESKPLLHTDPALKAIHMVLSIPYCPLRISAYHSVDCLLTLLHQTGRLQRFRYLSPFHPINQGMECCVRIRAAPTKAMAETWS